MPLKATEVSRPSHRLACLLLLLCSACFLNAQARAAGTCSVSNFAPPVVHGGRSVNAVSVADFNGDGKPDLAAANLFSNDVSVQLGKGDGTFLPAARFAAGRTPNSIEAADINGDGKLDLVMANGSSVEGSVTILFGDGAGGFPTKKGIFLVSGTSTEASFATVADFNQDGKADIAVGLETFNGVRVLLGDGAGNFPGTKSYNAGSTPSAGAAGDFNGDGKLDLAVANRFPFNSSTVSILTGDGAGDFSAPASFGVGSQPGSLVAADFNGDNKLDIATANAGAGNVSVLLGDGAGAFAAASHFGAGGRFPAAIASADFNGDGHRDLAVSGNELGSVLILQGDGVGQFSAAANYTGGGVSPVALVAKDLNGDAMPDLVVGNKDSQSVATLLNNCGAEPAAAVQFHSATYGAFEGDANAPTVFVIRTGTLAGAVSVEHATSDGTADGNDYLAAVGTLAFAEGEVAKGFTFTVKNDDLAEGVETVNLTLRSPTGAVLGGQATALVFIISDDPTPAVSVSDVSVTEGNGGTTDAVFNVTLPNPSASPISVSYETADATALAGEDYVGASGTLTFAPGETSKSLTVKVNGDTLDEITETFLLNLHNPTNATLADAQGVGTIRDDDASCPEPTFGPPANFAAGDTPWGMVAADFNRDGKRDLAVGNYNSNNISIMLGDGAGGFGAAVNFPVNTQARSVAAGDFNGDGKLDLVAAGSLFGTQVSVILGDGGGGFGPPTNYTSGSSTYGVAVGDFNGDGKDDIAAANLVSANVSVLISNGTGGFAAAISLTPGFVTDSVTVADVNGDGRPDILAPNQSSNQVSVFLNQGGGAFAPAAHFPAGQFPQRVAVGDFNGDGAADLAVVNETSRDVSILSGDGAGGFAAAGSYPVGVRSAFVLATDFNGDSLLDLAVSHWDGHGDPIPAQASVLFGNGRGGFSSPWDFVPGTGSVELTAADFNSDGKSDLVIANYSSRNVSLLLNGCSFATSAPKVQFGSPAYHVSEGTGKLVFTVVRSGDVSAPASVDYSTADGAASERSDYTAALGRLSFAAGEKSKAVTLFITDDAFVEGAETFTLTLGNVAGASLGAPAASTVTISSDDATSPATNPIDGTAFFIRQHYRDFLGRDPDAPGLAFWTNEIEQCGADAGCREVRRINVSAAFFLSIEFQQTGYIAYRARKAAFGNLTAKPVPITRVQMLQDVQQVGSGLVVGAENWELKLEQNKQAFFDQLTASAGFAALYPPAMTPEAYVDGLNQNAGGALSAGERDALVAALKSGAKTRAQALRAVAEDEDLTKAEFNKAFVLMQFFGYLRRDPDAAPDADFSGYQFWLGKLDDFNGDYIRAEMVKAFIDSIEYRQRFGQ